jgi:diguanylate cyclase (GGDEF)-like protein
VRDRRLIDARMRRQDRVFRLGGEEFILLLEDTDMYGAEVVAESIRAAVEQAALLPVQSVTISIGISQHNDGMSTEMWIRAADQALYRAKAAGRNRVQRAE